jgi:uncharacterized protein
MATPQPPIPLHRVGFRWSNGSGIDIEWTKGRGDKAFLPDLPDEIEHIELEAEPDRVGLLGIPAISYHPTPSALFEPLQLRENTDYFVDIALPVTKQEALDALLAQPGWPFRPAMDRVFQPDPQRRWRFDATGNLILSGLLSIGNYAGVLDLSTVFGTDLRCEVVCRKLGYADEFHLLLQLVAEEMSELLLQYDSPVSATFNVSEVTAENEAAVLFQLRHIMAPENLPEAVDDILGCLHSRLHSSHRNLMLHETEEPDIEMMASEFDFESLRGGGPLRRFFNGRTPRTVPTLQHFETRDTPENRYVKYFLEELLASSEHLRDSLSQAGKAASAREANAWVVQLEELLAHAVWRDVGAFRQFPSNSQVLQKGQGYRRILQSDLALQMGLELPWERAQEIGDGVQGDLRPVHELYEYWCFFVLRRILQSVSEREASERSSLVSISSDRLRVSLKRGAQSRVCFIYRDAGAESVEINLYYNKRFRRPDNPSRIWRDSYTASFDPDFSIELVGQKSGREFRHWVHFDAKYRAELVVADRDPETATAGATVADKDAIRYEAELRRVSKRDDLFKMHTYRDGILGSRGAYVLYPGEEERISSVGENQNLYVRHPSTFNASPEYKFPSVGVFPLSPMNGQFHAESIRSFLLEILEKMSNLECYSEELGPYVA